MQKFLKLSGFIGIILVTAAIMSACTSGTEEAFKAGYNDARNDSEQTTDLNINQEAINLVVTSITTNELNLETAKLTTKANPKGEGEFVYYPETIFSGVERQLVWLVIDGEAYPLNGPSKETTPNLKWPREADDAVWGKTGLDKYQATEAIEIVFGS